MTSSGSNRDRCYRGIETGEFSVLSASCEGKRCVVARYTESRRPRIPENEDEFLDKGYEKAYRLTASFPSAKNAGACCRIMEFAVKDPAPPLSGPYAPCRWCSYLVDAAIESNDRAISLYRFNLSWNSTGRRIGATIAFTNLEMDCCLRRIKRDI